MKRFYGVLIVAVLLSCKKEKEPFLCECSQLEGNFLTNHSLNRSDNNYNTSKYSDLVIKTEVDGNTLCAHGITFEITSDNQTIFSKTDVQEGIDYTLTFSNNYQSIDLEIDGPSQSFGPSESQSYTGNKTTLLASSPPGTQGSVHPYKSEIDGEYVLTYTRSGYQSPNEPDTTYQDTFVVSMVSDAILELDGTQWGFNQFYSRSNRTITVVDQSNDYRSISWGNDSLFLTRREVITFLGTNDTSQVNYVGLKL